MIKNLVWAQILAANFFFSFFFKNLASSVTRHHGQLWSCTISEKTNDPIVNKLSDGQRDGLTDESDFIGCCLNNVEHPKMKCQICQSCCSYYYL